MYEHSHDPYRWSYKKELTDDQLFHNFVMAVNQRLSKDDLNEEKNFKGIPGLKENFNLMSANNGNREYSKLWQWLNQQINSGVFNRYLTTKDFLNDEYMETTESYIERYILPYVKKPALKKYKKAIENQFPEEFTDKEIKIEEPVIQKTKSNAGRPKGSKNKKPVKEVFMPIHNISTVNGQIEIDTLINAIADLVWRKEGLMNSEYLDFLNISDSQKKYVNYLFNKNQKALDNKYWEIVMNKKTKVLMPKMRRFGYYGKANGTYELFGLSYIAEKSNISKNTLLYRLKHMSIKEAVKND
jgi:hypothetical protein